MLSKIQGVGLMVSVRNHIARLLANRRCRAVEDSVPVIVEALESRLLLSASFLPGMGLGRVGTVGFGSSTPEIIEASGLAASRVHAGVLYTHNDAEHDNRIFAINTSGHLVSEINVLFPDVNPQNSEPDFDFFDVEDLAIWHNGTTSRLLIADTGNKSARQLEANPEPEDIDELEEELRIAAKNQPVRIYVMTEPSMSSSSQNVGLDKTLFVTLRDASQEEVEYDIETLMVDTNGDLYLVTKHGRAGTFNPAWKAMIFKIAVNDWDVSPNGNGIVAVDAHVQEDLADETRVLELDFITGGDISPNGDEILLRNLRNVYLFQRAPGMSVFNALRTNNYRVLPYNWEPQGEAIAFDAMGAGYFTLSENNKGEDAEGEAIDDPDGQFLYYYARGEFLTASFKQDHKIIIDSKPTTTTYTGTRDTYIDNQSNEALEHFIRIDGDSPREREGILAFDNTFGTGAGQLDMSSVNMTRALLHLYSNRAYEDSEEGHRGDGAQFRRMLLQGQPLSWTEAVTYEALGNRFYARNNIEALAAIDFTVPPHYLQLVEADATTSVSAWTHPTTPARNEGWLIRKAGNPNERWDIASSEAVSIDSAEAIRQPELTIHYYKNLVTTMIYAGQDGWRVFNVNDTSNPAAQSGTEWYETGFDDGVTGWSAGTGTFADAGGYDDITITTTETDTTLANNRNLYYFRKTFNAGGVDRFGTLRLMVRTVGDRTIYLNGEEVVAATSTITTDNRFEFLDIDLSQHALNEGANLLAVMVERDNTADPVLFELQATALYRGDFNGDTKVDHMDIDMMLEVIVAESHIAAFDMDGDEAVDQDDLDFIIHEILETEYGDANLDGLVNITDLSIVATFFGGPGGWANGNFDGDADDGEVDIADLATVATFFGFDNMMGGVGGGGGSASNCGCGQEGVSEFAWFDVSEGTDVGNDLWQYIVSLSVAEEVGLVEGFYLHIVTENPDTLNQVNDAWSTQWETIFMDNNAVIEADELAAPIEQDTQFLWNTSALTIAAQFESDDEMFAEFTLEQAAAFIETAIAQIVLPEGETATICGFIVVNGQQIPLFPIVIGEAS